MFSYKAILRAGAAVLLLSALLCCKKENPASKDDGDSTNNGTEQPVTPPEPVSVSSVSVSPETLVLVIGESAALTATVLPEEAEDKTVAWSSSDPSIATVDAEGGVSAVAQGEAVITVTTNDGSHTAECSVSVVAPDVPDFGDGGVLTKATRIVLSATIGADAPATRVSYSDEDNVLKASWDAEETISVITYSGDNAFTCDLVTLDNFTYKGEAGKRTAEFTGTLSAGATSNIVVMYPALSEYEADKYGTPMINTNRRAISLQRFSSSYMLETIDTYGVSQKAVGSTAHLADYAVLKGTGTISDGKLKVNLAHITSVLKLDVTFPASGPVYKVTLVLRDSEEALYAYNCSGRWGYFLPGSARYGEPAANNTLFFGEWKEGNPLGFDVKEGEPVSLYWPFVVPTTECRFGPEGGSRLEIASYAFTAGVNNKKAVKVLENDIKIEPGKVYRVSVTLE